MLGALHGSMQLATGGKAKKQSVPILLPAVALGLYIWQHILLQQNQATPKCLAQSCPMLRAHLPQQTLSKHLHTAVYILL